MPAGVDYMRQVGTRVGSADEDPRFVRNPYALQEQMGNELLRNQRVRNDLLEMEDPEQERIRGIEAQQDADYDLEYRAPKRVDMMGGLGVRQQGWKNRADEEAASGYFDPWRSAQREHEEGFKSGLAERQYGYGADARRYAAYMGAQGRTGAAAITANGRNQDARTAAAARRAGQLTDDMGNTAPQNQQKVEGYDRQIAGQQGKPLPYSKFLATAQRQFGGDLDAAEEAAAQLGYYIDYDN